MKISPRIAASRILFNTFWITTCLGTGFALGSKATLPFQKKSIHFGELTWISEEARKAKISAIQSPQENIELPELSVPTFEPFQLKIEAPKKSLARNIKPKRTRNGFQALELAIQGLRKAQRPRLAPIIPAGPTAADFVDYQQAAYWFSKDFVLALVPRQKSLPTPQALLAKRELTKRVNTQSLTIQKSAAEVVTPKQQSKPKRKTQVTQKTHYPPVKIASKPHAASMQVQAPVQTLQVSQAEPELPQELKGKLAAALVDQQLTAVKKQKNEPLQASPTNEPSAPPPATAISNRKLDAPALNKIVAQIESKASIAQPETNNKSESLTCSQLPRVGFYNGMNTQICPQTLSWISKSGAEPSHSEGWLLAGDRNEHPTLSYYPAPNSGRTLVLDTNSLILLGVKRGVRVTRGMGAIVGRVPSGMMPSFLGHGEKPEWFDLGGEKYFAILNAEPGAGVLELRNEIEGTKNEASAATVFVPVLEDTITYLDLAKPETYQIKIKVLPTTVGKNHTHSPSTPIEYSVGISTTGSLQGVTRPNGTLELKGIPLIPGYPVFVDIVSRSRMTYRQALKAPDEQGVFTLSPPADAAVRTWFRQLAGTQKLSVAFEQGGILFSQWPTSLFDGFKNHYITRIKSLQQPWSSRAHTVLWNGQLSEEDPVEADLPRVFAAPIPEGLARVSLVEEGSLETHSTEELWSELIPVSPRVVHVITK